MADARPWHRQGDKRGYKSEVNAGVSTVFALYLAGHSITAGRDPLVILPFRSASESSATGAVVAAVKQQRVLSNAQLAQALSFNLLIQQRDLTQPGFLVSLSL